MLFKNFSNLCLNSFGVYLYNSELILSSPVFFQFFVNFNASSNSPDVIIESSLFSEFHSVLVRYEHSINVYNNVEMFSLIPPFILAVSFASLFMCFKILCMVFFCISHILNLS
jgi:hypothetical protein